MYSSVIIVLAPPISLGEELNLAVRYALLE